MSLVAVWNPRRFGSDLACNDLELTSTAPAIELYRRLARLFLVPAFEGTSRWRGERYWLRSSCAATALAIIALAQRGSRVARRTETGCQPG